MSTINPRGRALAQVSRAATQPARITQAARPTTSDPALNAWIGAMHEWRHVREGGGNPFEKVLTGRDLVEMGIATSTQITNPATRPAPAAPGVVISTPNGQAVLGWEQFTESIRNSRLIRDLGRRIDDPARFDELHARTRAMLLEELAPIDGKIRGEIRRVEEIATSTQESLAQEVTTIRASVARASAGVRQVRAASASESRATALQVTQVTARLNNFDGTGATVEQRLSAIADATTGWEASYTLKVSAGGAIAGYGASATDNGAGNATSAFIVQANKFAVVDSSYAGGLTNAPPASALMFGVDADGVYVQRNLRGGGDIVITGGAKISGEKTSISFGSAGAAIVANDSLAANRGVIAVANSSAQAVVGYQMNAAGAGIYAENTAGGAALRSVGKMTITDSTMVTNLNANYLGGYTLGDIQAYVAGNYSPLTVPIANIQANVARSAAYSTDGGASYAPILLKFS